LREAIQVISCGYEDKTEWGKEVSENKETWTVQTHHKKVVLLSPTYHLKFLYWIRLAGYMALLQKISWQDSRCTAMDGGLFTAYLSGLHLRGQLQLTCQIVYTRFFGGPSVLLRFSSVDTVQFGMVMGVDWSGWNDFRT
jgi:hypothetical protein